MIKSITGENIQAHVYSELHFDEGVNVITNIKINIDK